METKEKKIETAISKAHNYVVNVIKTQKRVLPLDEMYAGYSSMGFKPEFNKRVFEDFYYKLLDHLVSTGMLKHPK